MAQELDLLGVEGADADPSGDRILPGGARREGLARVLGPLRQRELGRKTIVVEEPADAPSPIEEITLGRPGARLLQVVDQVVDQGVDALDDQAWALAASS